MIDDDIKFVRLNVNFTWFEPDVVELRVQQLTALVVLIYDFSSFFKSRQISVEFELLGSSVHERERRR